MSGRGELLSSSGLSGKSCKDLDLHQRLQMGTRYRACDSAVVRKVDVVSMDRRAGVGPSLALADAFVSLHPNTSVGSSTVRERRHKDQRVAQDGQRAAARHLVRLVCQPDEQCVRRRASFVRSSSGKGAATHKVGGGSKVGA